MSAPSDDILSDIAVVMRTTFRLPLGHPVDRETTASDIDGWDSLSHSILIMGIEDQFGIELPVERAFELQNVGDLVDLVELVLNQSGQR